MRSPYARLNPYYMNRQGLVVRLNEDGTTTKKGLKASIVALTLTNLMVAASIYYGWSLRKSYEQDVATDEEPDTL